jgi:restriction endonuclease S subunit
VIGLHSLGNGYPLKRLGDVAEFLDAMRRNLAAAERHPGSYSYYGRGGRQSSIDRYIFDEPLLLLGEACSYAGSPVERKVLPIAGKSWVDKNWHVLRPKAGMDLNFLYRVLEHYDLTPFISGAQRDKLSKAQAANIVVPTPPLDEQRAIAHVLECADRLRDQRRFAQTRFEAFVRVLFLEMFGDPLANPLRWPQLPISRLAENHNARRSPAPRTRRSQKRPGTYPCYGAAGIVDWVDQPVFEGERLLVAEAGGNLLTRLSPVTRIVRGEFAVTRYAHVIAANGCAELRYLESAIELTELRPFLSATARPRLTRSGLDRITVPVPPLELQHEFCRRVDAAQTVIAIQHTSAQRLDELFVCLRYRALRGELQLS